MKQKHRPDSRPIPDAGAEACSLFSPKRDVQFAPRRSPAKSAALPKAIAREDDDFPFDPTPAIRVFDPAAFVAALDEDIDDHDGFVGPEEDRPLAMLRSRTTEDEIWARIMRKIVADPRRGWRRLLIGDAAMADRLVAATATMPHFAAVTGIVERAVRTSAATGIPVRFPPILMLSEPGLGKTYYARAVAAALETRVVPIALNATSDRGLLSGLSQSWRGARMGRLAKTILLECETASPIYLLDEIDKTTDIAGENVASVLLSALEPENAAAFVDEYLDLPIRLDHALWLCSANETRTIPPPLLSRMLVVEVPMPSREQARIIVRAIAAACIAMPLDEDAVDLLLDMSARRVRQVIEVSYPFAVCAGRDAVSAADVHRGIALVVGGSGRRAIGFTARLPAEENRS